MSSNSKNDISNGKHASSSASSKSATMGMFLALFVAVCVQAYLQWSALPPRNVDKHETAAPDVASPQHQQGDSQSSTSTDRRNLKWYLQGANETTQTPFVVIDDVLPTELLAQVRSQIEDIIADEDNIEDCTLARDDLDCGAERWLDFTLDDAKNAAIISTKARDLFEQAVLQIARFDMLRVLPSHIAAHVAGVSWRVLVVESGANSEVFHYDSDELLDYTLHQVPMIFPLLSTVTYLNNNGEPTVIFEQAMLTTSSDKKNDDRESTAAVPRDENLIPPAAYVSMPYTNKHIAFDSRLFHGSSAPISKNPGQARICIGMNYHTHQSMESQNEGEAPLDRTEIVPPLNLSADTIANEANAKIRPWTPEQLVPVSQRESDQDWKTFELNTFKYGFDYCQHMAPCNIQVRLPISQLLANEYDAQKPDGATVGFELTSEDFVVQRIVDSEAAKEEVKSMHADHQPDQPKTEDDDDDDSNGDITAEALALKMLQRRCEMYDHDLLAMNPPLNHALCGDDAGGGDESKEQQQQQQQ